jgi:micrococcal nuclease
LNLRELLPLGSQVTLEVDKKDLYGRSVAEIFDKKGTNINKQMTQLGFVVHYPFQKGCSQYQELEKAAKAKKVGVWSDSTFEMPWDYRKRKVIKKINTNK